MTYRNKTPLLIAFIVFLQAEILIAGESETNRQGQTYAMTLKPSALLATGGGIELGYHWNAQESMGLSAELDHFLVGGTAFAGVYYKRFFGNSFFTQGAVGMGERFLHDSQERGAAFSVIIGNEWQYANGFHIGADWIGGGYLAGFSGNRSGGVLHFPKLRLGYAF